MTPTSLAEHRLFRLLNVPIFTFLTISCAAGIAPTTSFETVRVVTIQSDLAPQHDQYDGPNMLYWVKSARDEHAWVYAHSSYSPTGACVEVHPSSTRYRVSMLVAVDEARCAGILLDSTAPEDRPFGDANVPRIEFH